MFENKFRNYNDFISNLKSPLCNRSIVSTFINPYSYYKIKGNKSISDSVDYIYFDGTSLCLLNNILYNTKIDRVSFDFSSIAGDVIKYSQKNGLSIIFVGGNLNESAMAEMNLLNLYPGVNLKVVDGFQQESDILSAVNCFDVIVFGMGCPLQEEYAIKTKSKLPKGKLIFTCGGFISQTAMKPDYYHPLIKRFKILWLQRFILHKHVRKRLLWDYPIFFVKFIKERINRNV